MNEAESELALSTAPVTVAGLTEYIKELLELDTYLHHCWVVGEISSAKDCRSGTFFTLSEPDGGAAIKCVVWSSQRDRLGQSPAVGEQAIVLGSLRLYPKRGEYQLNVWQILPAGEGLQALRYRQLKSRLEAEGLFAPNRKRPLPSHPQTVAVVTSPQAAAWGDIQRTLGQRYPGLRVLLSPATVQGELAPASIVKAIARVEKDNRAEVVILARGGGAVEDLACFNDERVVRAIAQCSLPIVTGIGHQRDESLADLVADRDAHTPTAAAELVVPDWLQLQRESHQRARRLGTAISQRLNAESDRLQRLKSSLQRLPQISLVEAERQLDRLRATLQRLPETSRYLERTERRHQLLRETLCALDPYAVLRRGYALAKTESGAIATSADDLAVGDTLTITLGDRRVRVRVEAIESE